MKYRNLTLIGTSHIAEQSLREVTAAIDKQKPDLLALELDRKRFYALTHRVRRKVSIGDIRRVGLKGFLFNLIGAWVEKKLGKVVGVEPGAEMLTAIKLAKKHNIRIALIDQDIEELDSQMEVIQKHGAHFMDSPCDLIHTYVWQIRDAIDQGKDPLQLPDRCEEVTFCV